nr:acyltransferase [uncultured Albidiferax sp.]
MKVKERYLALDGLRGIFSVAVVIHHFSLLQGAHLMRSAWLAVDAFFVLSGFVIALNYESRIKSGLGFLGFCRVRIERLYPMYFFALVIGIFSLLIHSDWNIFFGVDVFLMQLCGIFLIPFWGVFPVASEGLLNNHVIFPFNDPAWSLFFEVFSNIFFYFFVFFFGIGRRLLVVLLFFLFLVYFVSIRYYGLHSGYSQLNFPGGFPRVLFHFFVGCFIFKIQYLNIEFKKWHFFALLFISLLSFGIGNLEVMYVMLFVVSPFVIFVGSKVHFDASNVVGCILKWLGDVSFPIYILHYPLYRLLYGFFVFSDVNKIFLSVVIFVIVLIAAHLLIILERFLKSWGRVFFLRNKSFPV